MSPHPQVPLRSTTRPGSARPHRPARPHRDAAGEREERSPNGGMGRTARRRVSRDALRYEPNRAAGMAGRARRRHARGGDPTRRGTAGLGAPSRPHLRRRSARAHARGAHAGRGDIGNAAGRLRPFNHAPGWSGGEWGSGQPSLVYRAVLDSKAAAVPVELGLAGHGSPDGSDGEIHTDLAGTTTARSIVSSVTLTTDERDPQPQAATGR